MPRPSTLYHLPSNHKEPLQTKPKPARPFQEAAADLCFYAGKSYLVWVDCYSDWPIIAPLDKDTTVTRITTVCTEIFSQTAVPDIMWTDGGPQFTSKVFQNFLHQWGIIHRKSTPHYPQSNGKAEATVKAMKKILRAAWTGRFLDKAVLCGSLMQYRTHHQQRTGYHQPKSYMGIPYKIVSPYIQERSHQNGSRAQQRQNNVLSSRRRQPHDDTTPQPVISQRLM